MSNMHEWETINDAVTRFRVPGGWVYQFLHPVRASAFVFVPNQHPEPVDVTKLEPCFL